MLHLATVEWLRHFSSLYTQAMELFLGQKHFNLFPKISLGLRKV